MAWILTPALVALRQAFNERFPQRDRTTDGSIGDARHQQSPSGHNPDDTPGSRPEYEDLDSIPEVRAIDIDADLREPGVSMLDVIRAILATPADRDRLAYIIHRNTIWSRSSGWQPRPYYGDNPHTSHAHFSGHPDHDANDAPWSSVLRSGSREGSAGMAGTIVKSAEDGQYYILAPDGTVRRLKCETENGINDVGYVASGRWSNNHHGPVQGLLPFSNRPIDRAPWIEIPTVPLYVFRLDDQGAETSDELVAELVRRTVEPIADTIKEISELIKNAIRDGAA